MKTNESLVENSGIITHLQTVDCLKKNGWSVDIGPYYYDNISDSVREIDIVAEKQFNSDEYGPSVQVNIQLFIECKYIKHKIIFWFDEMNRRKALGLLERNTGLDIVEFRHSGDTSPDKFHYVKDKTKKVAKLFSTDTNIEDIVYKSISQCLRATIYYEQWNNGPVSVPFLENNRVTKKIVRYPVVVCGNFPNVNEVIINCEHDKRHVVEVKNNFLLETNYVFLNKEKTNTETGYFLIDFVDLNNLDIFLKEMEIEAQSIVFSMSGKH